MSGYYPVVLELSGRPCLVVGGGPVAEAKVEGLLNAGARITLVSPRITERLRDWAAQGRLRHLARDYRPGDVRGHQLAFVATGDGAVNAAVAAEGRARGVWVNAADDPARCDFILPAVVRRRRLLVAVSTGGASPALAGAVRRELEAFLTDDYAVLADIVADVRLELRHRARRPPAAAWRRALTPGLRRLVAAGRREEVRRRLIGQLEGAACG